MKLQMSPAQFCPLRFCRSHKAGRLKVGGGWLCKIPDLKIPAALKGERSSQELHAWILIYGRQESHNLEPPPSLTPPTAAAPANIRHIVGGDVWGGVLITHKRRCELVLVRGQTGRRTQGTGPCCPTYRPHPNRRPADETPVEPLHAV